jgi:hypothetical protein
MAYCASPPPDTFEPAGFAVHTVAGGDSPICEDESVD